MNEFELIQNFFQRQDWQLRDNKVVIGIGDDAAIIDVAEYKQLVLCVDTLVGDVHFPVNTSPADVAYKSLAVNLSDMAAMGAEPKWATLSLTVPENDENWFADFAIGFKQLASRYSLSLIGGDLGRGPLSVTVQLQGILPAGQKALTRAGAGVGDNVYVTGYLGAASYALKTILAPEQWPPATDMEIQRLQRPEARLSAGQELVGLASSCVDVSDGLQADLGHVLQASQVGAELCINKLPLSSSLQKLDRMLAYELAMTGGDDYELCFTMPADVPEETINDINSLCPVTHIGCITQGSGTMLLKDENGKAIAITSQPYKHF